MNKKIKVVDYSMKIRNFKFSLFFIFQSLILGNSIAQNNTSDSLHAIIRKTKNDVERIKNYLQLGSYFQNFNADSALFYVHKGNDLALKIKSDYYQVISKRDLIWDYYLIGDYDKCFQITNEAFDILKVSKDKKIKKEFNEIKSSLYGNLGNIHWNQSNFNKALENYFKAYKLIDNSDNKRDQASMLGNIGLVYLSLNDIEKSLDYQFRALKISEQINDEDGKATRLANIGGIYGQQKDYQQALIYFLQSLEIFKKLKSQFSIGVLYANIGFINIVMGKYEEAEETLLKAIEISEIVEDKNNLALCFNNLGELYVKTNKLNEAEKYLNKALKLAHELGAIELLKQINQDYSKLYRKQKKYDLALKYYEKYIVFRDSITNDENKRNLMQKEFKFEYDKKTAEDSIKHAQEQKIIDSKLAEQKALADKQDLEIEHQKKQRIFLFVGIFLLLIFSGFLYNRFRFIRKQNRIIEEQKSEVENQKHLVEVKNNEILDSITYAKRIQDAILPSNKIFENLPFENFVFYQPKDIVAGDFYWLEIILENNKKTILIAAADCTGHGVPGAMVSVICHNALNRAVREFKIVDPGKILDKTCELVVEQFEKSDKEVKDGMDISLCKIEIEDNEFVNVEWAGANNPLWILKIAENEIEEIRANKQPIGKFANIKPFQTNKINISKGDSLFLFTDGYQDQFGGPYGKKFKTALLKNIILQAKNDSHAKIKQTLKDEFDSWKGKLEQVDDVCVIGIKI